MKIKPILTNFAALGLCLQASGQGTFVYDQQSSDEFNVSGSGVAINAVTQPGQSFVPALSSVGFIRLHIRDNNAPDVLGTALFVNLRSGSLDGPILATSSLVQIANGNLAPVNFFFPSNPSVIPGITYYFDVARQGGADTWTANISLYNYGGGTLHFLGGPDPQGWDMWFREGQYIPEPSSLALFTLGTTLLLSLPRWRRNS